jgi:hypothetical protein
MTQTQNLVVFFRMADTSSYSIEERLVAAGLAVAHRHLRHHRHGHHVVLTLPHQTIRCGVLSREEWLCVARTTTITTTTTTTTTTKICAELWKTPFAVTQKMLRNMSQRTWRHIRLCVQHQGEHTESLDMLPRRT